MGIIDRRSLAKNIKHNLRERILSGEIVPGERIVEQKIAHEMGTSQGPVREALAFLCQEGLLIALPHRGTFVTEVSEQEARMAYALREAVEPMAVELAMLRVDETFVARLELILFKMHKAAEASDVVAYVAADMEFHTSFYELAGTDILMSVWTRISSTIRKFVAVAGMQYVENLHDSADDHTILIDLVRRGETSALKEATIEHVNNIWRRIGLASDN
jgi:DNA-binding GntR family transcriptional regulator